MKSSPATNNITVASTADTKTQNSSPAKEDTVTEVKENENTAPNVQMPDNIKLNLQYVDVIYEMTDGRSNIEISTSTQQQANATMASTSQPVMESAAVQERSVMQTASAFSDNIPQQESFSIDWYEVIKILLLAALFIVLVPKPKKKRISQNEIDTPKPKKKLKQPSEVDAPRPKRRKEKE